MPKNKNMKINPSTSSRQDNTFKLIIATGVAHKVPADLRKALTSSSKALSAWGDITPLARNEWICWVVSAKKPETRTRRVERTRAELIEGMRRPCCWAGCPHR